jgi:hypothetical protein
LINGLLRHFVPRNDEGNTFLTVRHPHSGWFHVPRKTCAEQPKGLNKGGVCSEASPAFAVFIVKFSDKIQRLLILILQTLKH